MNKVNRFKVVWKLQFSYKIQFYFAISMKALIVEDNEQLAVDICEYLQEQGFSAQQVNSFVLAEEKIAMYP